MKIALIAPHPGTQNGIGDYNARLIEELKLAAPSGSFFNPTQLLSRKSDQNPVGEPPRSLPRGWPELFLEVIDAHPVQLVHIQYGLYMGYGFGLSRLLIGLRARRIPCVVTMHGVWPSSLLIRWPSRLYRILADRVDRVIVHQRAGTVDLLEAHGIPSGRIVIIPHGTWGSGEVAPDPDPGRKGEEENLDVLFAGNVFRRKGLHVVLRSFPDVVRRLPHARLLVVGKERNDHFLDRLYLVRLHLRMRPGMKAGWLIRRQDYVSNDELWARIRNARVTIFPYLRQYGSASGIFHRVLALGRPAVCSRIPTFSEAIDAWGDGLADLFPPANQVQAWSQALIRILSDDSLRRQAMDASAALGRETSWPVVAGHHLRLYRSILPDPAVSRRSDS